MRAALVVLCSLLFLLPLTAEELPACNRQVFTRRGNRIRISTAELGRLANQKLTAAHAHFHNLQITSPGVNQLKISGEKDGTPISIEGPVKVNGDGLVTIHAAHIKKNGDGVKDIMGLFGKTLDDYVKGTRSISAHDNDLDINPDALLGVSGQVRSVRVQGSFIHMMFGAPPCR